MKKVYNFLLIILIVCAAIVGSMIFIKYYNNHVNEKEITEKIIQIEDKLDNLSEAETLNEQYEGYNIEGILEIPKINIKYPILNTTTEETMKLSVTKFWGPAVNEVGNYTVAGHNNRDGTMFSKTKQLEIGDTIKLTDLKNNTIDYKIFKIYSVDPNDISIITSVNPEIREVTLITCTNGNKNRLIIKAKQENI